VEDERESIDDPLLLLKRRRAALAEFRLDPGDPILASLDEMIAALERGEDPFTSASS
jgi:hypothetical protein